MIIISSLFTFLTYELSKLKYIGAIRASCLVGVIIALSSKMDLFVVNPPLLFGATFVGMCSAKRIGRVRLLVASLLYPFICLVLSRYFAGIGGLLGMSAFLSVLCVSFKTKPA